MSANQGLVVLTKEQAEQLATSREFRMKQYGFKEDAAWQAMQSFIRDEWRPAVRCDHVTDKPPIRIGAARLCPECRDSGWRLADG